MSPNLPSFWLQSLLIKRSIFISYHHDHDQSFQDSISRTFADVYGIVTDNSLERAFDSDDPEYVMRRIREQHVTGTSCTIVLCGAETRWRKYVDWEIKATLDKNHGLVGVLLPTNPPDALGRYHKPDRLQDNIDSGFAHWTTWAEFTRSPEHFKATIELAIAMPSSLIVNSRPMRQRNGSF